MKNRYADLLQELALEQEPCPQALDLDAGNIRRRVNRTLNAVPRERTIYMKQKLTKTLVLASILISLAATTVLAGSNSELIGIFFAEDSPTMQEQVKTPYESVSDGRFTLTLEEVLASQDHALFLYSISGLTPDAVVELMSDSFVDMDTMSLSAPAGTDSLWYSSVTTGELMEKRSDSTRYWACAVSGLENPEGLPLRLSLNKMSGDKQPIDLPLKSNLETLELTLPGQPYGQAQLSLSPIGIVFQQCVSQSASHEDIAFVNLFFRMQDGSIQTYSQLAKDGSKSSSLVEEGTQYLRYEHNALLHSILDLSDVQSVIVGGIEYDVKDVSKTKEVELDKTFYPFEQIPVYHNESLWVPLRDVCEKLGATIQWQEGTKSALITYRGSVIEVTDGSNVYVKDGREYSMYDSARIAQGKLIMPPDPFCKAMQVDMTFKTGYQNAEVKDWIWIILP